MNIHTKQTVDLGDCLHMWISKPKWKIIPVHDASLEWDVWAAKEMWAKGKLPKLQNGSSWPWC